jgi:hypothetical protein
MKNESIHRIREVEKKAIILYPKHNSSPRIQHIQYGWKRVREQDVIRTWDESTRPYNAAMLQANLRITERLDLKEPGQNSGAPFLFLSPDLSEDNGGN